MIVLITVKDLNKENYYNCVYVYTNVVNGKTYVGQTKNLKNRHKRHLQAVYNEYTNDYNYPIHVAMREYGVENFKLQVIEYDLVDEDKIDEIETYYIKELHSLVNENGYNIATRGYGIKGSNTWIGRTEEEVERIIEKQKETWKQGEVGYSRDRLTGNKFSFMYYEDYIKIYGELE